MNVLELLLYGQTGASLLMLGGWLVALKINNTSYVDVLWAYGVGILAFCYLYLSQDQTDPDRLLLLQCLVLLWSIRLGTYLLRRCLGKPEDARYAFIAQLQLRYLLYSRARIPGPGSVTITYTGWFST